jgi:ATP-binding cassette subfamily F protein uup
MALITLDNAVLSYSDRPLLDGASCSIQEKERVCLVGRNGAGKSTLLKIFAGRIVPDSGSVVFQNDLTVSMLDQDPPRDSRDPVWMYVIAAKPELPELMRSYENALQHGGVSDGAISELHSRIEESDGFTFRQKVINLLERMELPAYSSMEGLSGGQLRRIALARAVADSPKVLLLDEPTNHLDVKAITELRNFLLSFDGAVVFISHDRMFIDETATRILELDRGVIYSCSGNYRRYLADRDLRREIEDKSNKAFDKKLSEEEIWIRQGVKARRTRNEGRVRELKRMREERRNRRSRQGTVSLKLNEAQQSGQIVFDGTGISFSFGDRQLVKDLDINIRRGDKIALVGRNGCGKTTLIKLLLGELKPDSGSIRSGSNISVAYFDQYREILDESKTVLDNLTSGRTEVTVSGHRKSVMGYLQDFLFEPRRAYVPVSALSGGEKNRLLLARIFLKEFNVLILDEPTNDLDIETLELLEELLVSYKGTLIIVSHDRWFIDNVATELWYFQGDGTIEQVVGGYEDLNRYLRTKNEKSEIMSKSAAEAESAVSAPAPVREKSRLSYREEKELEQLPVKIAELEEELEEIQKILSDPSFYTRSQDEIKSQNMKAAEIEEKITEAYARWEELEELKNRYEEAKGKK